MIDPADFYLDLLAENVTFFAGVPNAPLKNFCSFMSDHTVHQEHIVTANEGNAVALAAGHYLATGQIGAVYMQNSGLGNAINLLMSLMENEAYRIPVLLIIGWRGKPGVEDGPQYRRQGQMTTDQLDLLQIPFSIVDKGSDCTDVIRKAVSLLHSACSPVAILVRDGTFSGYERKTFLPKISALQREEALKIILSFAKSEDFIVSATGKISQEIFEIRSSRGGMQRNFLTIGSAGHASSIALGIALRKPGRNVICLDDDGSLLTHIDSIPIIGDLKPDNFMHVLLNDYSHESAGSEPTVAGRVDFGNIVLACGYNRYYKARNATNLSKCWEELQDRNGPTFVEIVVDRELHPDLGRQISMPEQNKPSFRERASD